MNTRDVSVLILKNKDKILLQERSTTAKRFAGSWGLFGGGIDEGETPEEGLKRELLEELNFKIDKFKLIIKKDYVLKEKNESGTIFVFESNYNNEKITLKEGASMRWVTTEEAFELNLSPDIRIIFEKLFK